MDRDLKYGEAALAVREKTTARVKNQLDQGVTDKCKKLQMYIEKIENWEDCLTSKQLECVKKYLSCFNAYQVDFQLNLSSGTTHRRIFGSKDSLGAIGRLEKKYLELGLQENNLIKYEKEEIKEEKKEVETVPIDIFNKIKNLFNLISSIPNYNQYITKVQNERLYHFIRLRSFKSTASTLSIREDVLINSLIGKNSALSRLEKIAEDKIITSWDKI